MNSHLPFFDIGKGDFVGGLMSNGWLDKLQKLGLSDQETFNGGGLAQRTDIHSQLMGTSGTHILIFLPF